MRISSNALDERLYTQKNRYFNDSKNRGIINYGEGNDYPDCFERLILSSQTATACWRIMSSFIAGEGFVDPEIGKTIVGYDRGNKITLDRLKYMIASSLAMYNGVYIHANKNIYNEVSDVSVLPFKNCRLSVPDDFGYSGKTAVCQNWSKLYNKNKVKWYNDFSLNDVVTEKEIQNAGGINEWTGQIYHFFHDNHFAYPLSIFDPVEFEMNTEQLVQVYKNREIANGFNSKTVIYVPRANSDDEFRQMQDDIHSFMGPDGAKELIVECDYDQDANLITNGYKFEALKSNIDADMFSETYQKSLTNNIRKAANGMPAVLIDYSNEGLGQVSGESLKSAYSYYNAMTADYRENVRDILSTLFEKTIINGLEGKDFEIRKKEFTENEE